MALSPSAPEFWDEFYEDGVGKNTYEWYLDSADAVALLVPHVKTGNRILQIGCGNSLLAEQLLEEALVDDLEINSIDICETAVEMMQKRLRDSTKAAPAKKTDRRARGGAPKPPPKVRLTYELMDARSMTYADDTFDVVIEKGAIDALLSHAREETGDDPDVLALLRDVYRVLKPGAKYLIISGNDEFLLSPYFQAPEFQWDVSATKIEKSRSKTGSVFSTYFFYLLHSHKGQPLREGEGECEEEADGEGDNKGE